MNTLKMKIREVKKEIELLKKDYRMSSHHSTKNVVLNMIALKKSRLQRLRDALKASEALNKKNKVMK